MSQPNKIPRAFAASGDKNSIPDSSGGLGFASWQEGFPAITSEPFANGGIAPKRADFNGIFNALSLATVWQQQGGVYAYDNVTDYEVGNLVEDSGDIYQCMIANGPNSTIKSPSDQTVWSKVINVQDLNSILASYLPLTGGTVSGQIYQPRKTFSLTPNTTDLTVSIANTERNYICGNIIQLAADLTCNNITTAGWYNVATVNLTNLTDLISGNMYFVQPEKNTSTSAVSLRSRAVQLYLNAGILYVKIYLNASDSGIEFMLAKTLVCSTS